MPFAQLANQNIVGLFANAQPGLAEEWLEDDDPKVIAFNTPPLNPKWDALYDALKGSPVYAKLWTASREPEPSTTTTAALTAIRKTNRVSTALTAIITAIASHDIESLEFAIATVRADLIDIALVGDLSADELIWMNDQFAANDFELRLI